MKNKQPLQMINPLFSYKEFTTVELKVLAVALRTLGLASANQGFLTKFTETTDKEDMIIASRSQVIACNMKIPELEASLKNASRTIEEGKKKLRIKTEDYKELREVNKILERLESQSKMAVIDVNQKLASAVQELKEVKSYVAESHKKALESDLKINKFIKANNEVQRQRDSAICSRDELGSKLQREKEKLARANRKWYQKFWEFLWYAYHSK